METSRSENIPFRVIGAFRMRSVFVGALTFLPSGIISGFLQRLDVINNIFASILFFGPGIAVFFLVEHLHKGRYPMENLEKYIAKFRIKNMKFSLESVKEANVEIKKSSAHDKINYDENSWYLPTGEEIIGIKIVEESTDLNSSGKILYSESRFDSFCSALLQILPLTASVKFIRPNFLDIEIPEYLKSKKVMKGDFYIFIKLPLVIGVEEKKREINKLVNGSFVRMTHSEMAIATEKIFFPHNLPSLYEKPLFKSGFSFESGFVKGSWFGENMAVISLVQLPRYVEDDFQNIYAAITDMISSISVTVHTVKFESSLMHYFKEKIKIKKGVKGENDDALKLQHDEISCLIQVSILLHGTKEQIAYKMSEIESISVKLGNDKRPIFGQDVAFVGDAIKSFLPGTDPRIPYRKQKITNINEVLYYLPRPKFSKRVNNPDLSLRTIDNRIFQIKFTPQYPTAYISPPGSGKSLFLALSILNHIRKKSSGGVGGCYIEIGASFKFLSQEGLADAWLMLVKEKEFLPLEDHPLRAFLSFGPLGREAAIEWICELCGIDFEKESAIIAVIRSLVINCESEKKYALDDFYIAFKNKFEEQINADEIWKNRDQNLKNFIDPDVFGKIFVPKNPNKFNWDNARFIYFTTTSTKVTHPKKVYGAFFSMAIALCELLCEKHTSKQEEPLEMQFIVDEIHAARDSIPQNKIRTMNSQGRKDGMRSEFATQELPDLVIDDEDVSKKFGVIATTRRLFFKENPGELISYFLKSSSDMPQKLKRIESVAKSNIELMSQGKFAWGYIDENKEIHQLLIDVNKTDLWASTTHAGSIAIRQACLRTGFYDYWKICELLAMRGPVELPQFIPPEEEIQKIVDRVVRFSIN